MEYKHVPVMLGEAIFYLSPKSGGKYIDCTLGGGGYTLGIAKEIGPEAQILAVDLDKLAINNFKKIIKKESLINIKTVHDNFKNLFTIVKNNWPGFQTTSVAGIVFDLGLSSAQLQDRSRGFSFKLDAPLDMAFGNTTHNSEPFDSAQDGLITHNILNKYKQFNLEKIIKDYGEERYASLIAKGIVEYRRNKKIERTGELVEIIKKAVPERYVNNKKIHFATRTFQAFRIATNDELNSLKEALNASLDLLKPGGRLVMISYHSLEDRIVKQFIRDAGRACICPPEIPICQCQHERQLKKIEKGIIYPTVKEITKNPRARSAKMRVAEKL